ncbi:MAG: transcription-repair coupling factor [Bacteroidales bacterium]
MKTEFFLDIYKKHPKVQELSELLDKKSKRIFAENLKGSARAAVISASLVKQKGIHLVVIPEKEQAAYFCNDLENIFQERDADYSKKKILFYPTSYQRPYEIEKIDNANVLLRTEVLSRVQNSTKMTVVVTHPEALSEKVITKSFLNKNTLKLKVNESVNLDFISDVLLEYSFERVDFVVEPGQFAIRGGIIDVFSFSNDLPFRIEFFGDEVESIRTFDPEKQLSIEKLSSIHIVPNLHQRVIQERRQNILEYLPSNVHVWIEDIAFCADIIQKEFDKAEKIFQNIDSALDHLKPQELFCSGSEWAKELTSYPIIEFGTQSQFNNAEHISFHTSIQPSFNKNFELLFKELSSYKEKDFQILLSSDNLNQIERVKQIALDMGITSSLDGEFLEGLNCPLHEGFVDDDLKLLCFTDHQIFERYQRFHLRNRFKSKEKLSLKELYDLQPGDYVTHIDHGVGRFEGLSRIENNGKLQEVIRLTYKNSDILYVSIHSLHRISKYTGKEGTEPKLNKLGSQAWNKLKQKTKSKVKDIARELIHLYAKRKAAKGFQYSNDSYLQTELEASFIYEDTPDQYKATVDTKKDMEQAFPMDRLVCGDVGFGKTEIAIRAAFKAVTDGKQVAILVPTTILALQHYKTFRERLIEFPVDIDYINRFKSAKKQKETLKKLEEGKLDIIIGTHRLVGKDIKFNDLGLLVIDEEQKFGVAVKEKLKSIKVNVDTLTLTATPIPRTLQFSLMGARDLSIINTPPPNRYPVETQLRSFSPEIIRDAISYEVSRGGQVFFVHNRVGNILDIEAMIKKFVPGVRVGIAHGKLDGTKLEKVMLGFIEGEYDVLLATKIIESGLDISNANTIIINEAQHFGLSELHQMRGRVGRSNKKAFCYLLSPPMISLTQDARKRLKAIEEFSELGGGFNVAMRDLDIRGAGDILGGEQSGFISDIGFEMYHKILDEAIQELKEDEFKDTFAEEKKEKKAFVYECQIETDLALMIPDFYLDNIAERLNLYKELDHIQEEDKLQEFTKSLEDRFGPIPKETSELIQTIRLRWKAKKMGVEKIVLKFEKMVVWFINDQKNTFYESKEFTDLLQYVQMNSKKCTMREKDGKLSLSFKNIKGVSKALKTLEEII